MNVILPLILSALKGLLLLAAAAALSYTLRNRAARVRSAVWAVALVGCLAIPAVAPIVPEFSLPVPTEMARWAIVDDGEATIERQFSRVASVPQSVTVGTANEPPITLRPTPARGIDWKPVLLTVWIVGFALMSVRLTIGLCRMALCVGRAREITDSQWLSMLEATRNRVGCRRRIRLLASEEVEVPATVGVLRPAIVLPLKARAWVWDRRAAVLLHETIHIARFDWPLRMIARIARAAYWFNPIVWWATRQLDLEQELACDEEVLAMGTRASSYACHLLGIARHALPCPAPAIPALGMARKTHLEERIMSILNRTTNRRVSKAVLIPTVIAMAAMVPALAAVYPSDPEPRSAGPELRQIIEEMQAIEEKMEPHLARIEEIEIDMEPKIEMLNEIEVEIDESRLQEIEEQMQPYLERLEDIEIDMEPYLEKMEEFEEQFGDLELHIEDGTIDEVQEQIQQQMSDYMARMEDIHIDLEPYHQQMEEIYKEMEHLHVAMGKIHVDMEPIHAQLEDLHIHLEPFHEQMEMIHREMEPFHEELELLGERFERAVARDIESWLRLELGSVTSPGTDFSEAAHRIAEAGHIHVDDGLVEIDAPRDEARQILSDLLGPQRIGTTEVFETALDNTADGLSPMTISID